MESNKNEETQEKKVDAQVEEKKQEAGDSKKYLDEPTGEMVSKK
jgi:hypothetical protein